MTVPELSIPSAPETSSDEPSFTPVPGRVCACCGTTTTPLWRNGPLGPKTLCNACGVRDGRRASKGWAVQRTRGNNKSTGASRSSSAAVSKAPSSAASTLKAASFKASAPYSASASKDVKDDAAGITTRFRRESTRVTDSKETSAPKTSGFGAGMKRSRSGRNLAGSAAGPERTVSNSEMEEEELTDDVMGHSGEALDWDRIVRASLLGPYSDTEGSKAETVLDKSREVWISVARGGSRGIGAHLCVLRGDDATELGLDSGMDGDEVLRSVRPVQLQLTTIYRRISRTLRWWPDETAQWGLEFNTREQYVAFKVLLMECCEVNQKLAALEVHIPACVELKQEDDLGAVPTFSQPEQYIRAQRGHLLCARWLPGAAAPLYDLDEDDRRWLQQGNVALTELQMERLVDTFEQAAAESEDGKASAEEVAELLLTLRGKASTQGGGLPSILAIGAMYAYWLQRRERHGAPLLSRYAQKSATIPEACQSPDGKETHHPQAFVCGEEAEKARRTVISPRKLMPPSQRPQESEAKPEISRGISAASMKKGATGGSTLLGCSRGSKRIKCGMEKKSKRQKKVAGDVAGRPEKESKVVRDVGRLRHETMTPDISEQKPGQAEGCSRPVVIKQSTPPSEGGLECLGNAGGQQPSRSSERSSEQEVRDDGDVTEDSDSEEEYLHSCWGEGTAQEVKGSQGSLAPAWSPQEPTPQGSDGVVNDNPMAHRGLAQPIQAEAAEEDSEEAAPGEEEAMEEEGAMSSWADTVEQHLAVLADDAGANGYLGGNDGMMAELPYASSDAMLLPELDIEAPMGGAVAALKAGWDEPEEGGKSAHAAKACMVQASASMVPVAASTGEAGAPDRNVNVANPSITEAPSNAEEACVVVEEGSSKVETWQASVVAPGSCRLAALSESDATHHGSLMVSSNAWPHTPTGQPSRPMGTPPHRGSGLRVIGAGHTVLSGGCAVHQSSPQ